MADMKEKGLTLLSKTTGISLQTSAATTLYTVPAGKTCILHSAALVCVTTATASATAVVTIGRVGTLTDFVGNQTLTNLAAVTDMVTIMPVPHATVPVAGKIYAAGVVIQLNVGTQDADGPSSVTCFLYGTLY